MVGDFDLGTYTRPITTNSVETQCYFDQGLKWCYGFNHEAAIKCFQTALKFDSACAMAYWGIAYASGPFYNKPWEFFGTEERKIAAQVCYEMAKKAEILMSNASAVEQALISALRQRYAAASLNNEVDFRVSDQAYARSMKHVYQAFPEDLDVIALYIEALITQTPWKLWDIHNGEPASEADTGIALAVLDAGLRLLESPRSAYQAHPGIMHMAIHLLEMSPYPERALSAADALRDLVPDSGHLCHMPSHIDVLCGHYQQALVASDKAIVADAKYLAQVGPYDFYTTACCHDFHLKMYAAMLSGRYKAALDATNGIVDLLTEDVLRVDKPHLANTLEAYYSMKMHVLVRFGQWQTIIDAPHPSDPQLYCVTLCMSHYAKGIAYAAVGDIDAAEKERQAFQVALTKVSPTRRFFNNRAVDVLAVGIEMLNGEFAYRQAAYETAFAHLQRAVYLDDNLAYTEPWAWMHPPRHALGALLLEQDQVEAALQVYRADLGLDDTLSRPLQHPDNVWGLHGYVECLMRLQREQEALVMQRRLDIALARTDVEITASCFCRQNKMDDCCHGKEHRI